MAKKRSGGREKTQEERRAYHQQLGTQTSGATERSFTLGSAPNSTGHRPSPDDDEGAGLDVPAPAISRTTSRDGINWSAISAVVGIVGLVVGAALYVESIKSRVHVTETRMNSIEKAQDAAETGFRRELQRLEATIERRFGELFTLFRDRSKRPSAAQTEKPPAGRQADRPNSR